MIAVFSVSQARSTLPFRRTGTGGCWSSIYPTFFSHTFGKGVYFFRHGSNQGDTFRRSCCDPRISGCHPRESGGPVCPRLIGNPLWRVDARFRGHDGRGVTLLTLFLNHAQYGILAWFKKGHFPALQRFSATSSRYGGEARG